LLPIFNHVGLHRGSWNYASRWCCFKQSNWLIWSKVYSEPTERSYKTVCFDPLQHWQVSHALHSLFCPWSYLFSTKYIFFWLVKKDKKDGDWIHMIKFKNWFILFSQSCNGWIWYCLGCDSCTSRWRSAPEGLLHRNSSVQSGDYLHICFSVIVANEPCVTKRYGEHLSCQSWVLWFHESFRKYRKAALKKYK
jgi:hypothetical protein